MSHREGFNVSRRGTETQRELKQYEITPRPAFAVLALSAVPIVTLIHRKERGGRQEPPSTLDMDMPNYHDAAKIARLIQCHNLCGSFSLRAKKATFIMPLA